MLRIVTVAGFHYVSAFVIQRRINIKSHSYLEMGA